MSKKRMCNVPRYFLNYILDEFFSITNNILYLSTKGPVLSIFPGRKALTSVRPCFGFRDLFFLYTRSLVNLTSTIPQVCFTYFRSCL